MAIAFFDLDHTLLKGANGNMVVRYMVRRRLLGPGALWRAARYTLLYRLNRIPYMEVYRWTFRECGKYPLPELLEMLDEAYARYILPSLYREGRDKIAEHKARGHLTVIATAAGEYISEKVRVQLGADDRIAATAPVRDGHLTDRLDEPLPFGEGKLERAREFARARGASLEDCYFYSDSLADLPLLEAVGHPVAVNPSRGLLRVARGRGWPVLRWKETLGGEAPAEAERLGFRDSPEEAGA
jgi:HAD superfamily hydrolase (TIGR01490 family)